MSGTGYGKAILFGEHFVVHNEPAIVAGLKNLKTVMDVEEGTWNHELDEPSKAGYSAVAKACGIEGKTFTLNVKEMVPLKQNLGSSAAFYVSFARALNKKYKLGLKNEAINRAAYEGEKAIHGKPSGIDNSASTYGKPLLFRKTPEGSFKISKLKIGAPLHLVISNTGPKKGTGELVAHFGMLKEKNAISKDMFKMYRALFKGAKDAIKKGDLQGLGFLMDINHGLLASFGLSTPKIEEARFLMRENGVLGSKITGAGGGGNIIGLFASQEEAEKAREAMESRGFRSFYARIERCVGVCEILLL
jgi:mevalonate kinase